MITIILDNFVEIETPAIRKTETWALHCAYHKGSFCEDMYSVTHIPTGKVVGEAICSLEEATKLFTILRKDFPNFTTSCSSDKIKQTVSQFYKETAPTLEYELAQKNPDLWEVMDNDGTRGLLDPNTRMIIWEDGVKTENEWDMIFLFMHNMWFQNQEFMHNMWFQNQEK